MSEIGESLKNGCGCSVVISAYKECYFLLQYPFEALFRSEQYTLVDNACREYLFLAEFFKVQAKQALTLFNQILGKTMNLLVVSCHALCYIYLLNMITDTCKL
jgi:hypothetical protein